MKKLFLLLLVTGATVTFSCNPKDNKSKTKNDDKENVTNNDGGDETVETKATAELCNCINNSLEDMSPKARKMLVKAGKSDDPAGSLKTQIQNIDDEAEKQSIANEFQQFEKNTQLQKCSDKIKKKYDLNDEDKKEQKKIMNAAKENDDCDLVYALMKLGMQDQENHNTNDQ